MNHHPSLLCLGDSYTIGESLPLHEGFPYQLVQQLRRKNWAFQSPEIVAQTGWTSGELAQHLLHHQYQDHYDFVTLLIGVNNQYRGLALADYATDGQFLLKKALHFTKEQAKRVMVLSIPDWGLTPFAADRNKKNIAEEIDAFNKTMAGLAQKAGVHFVNITEELRTEANNPQVLAKDGLHYSAQTHGKWAEKLVPLILAEGL
ncbi:MAG: SGNH/GDSL hydrolase family protein [Sphingobacteriia bacterium]|nr:MAG: SGNH/GDSL hydrolase family protein [Sphingobacteriia bacterium]